MQKCGPLPLNRRVRLRLVSFSTAVLPIYLLTAPRRLLHCWRATTWTAVTLTTMNTMTVADSGQSATMEFPSGGPQEPCFILSFKHRQQLLLSSFFSLYPIRKEAERVQFHILQDYNSGEKRDFKS